MVEPFTDGFDHFFGLCEFEILLINDSSNFHSTRWTVVLRAGSDENAEANSALSILIQQYWHPVYSFIRRSGKQAVDAQDLTQEFFAQLLEKNSIAAADENRGRFRTFLLTLVKRFLIHQYRKEQTQKRGGGQTLLSFDFEVGVKNYSIDPEDSETPEKIFNRSWAITFLENVLLAVKEEYEQKGKGQLFNELKGFLSSTDSPSNYERIAERLGMSEGAIRVAVHRMRQRYRLILRAKVADTVHEESEIAEELAELMKAVSVEG